MANPVIHFELPVRKAKVNKVRRFYEDVFGWNIEKMKGMDYWSIRTEKTDKKGNMLKKNMINGGMGKRTIEKGPVIYLQVKSIKHHLKKIEARGGKTITPYTPIPNMGGFARFKDPDGNLVGIYQSK